MRRTRTVTVLLVVGACLLTGCASRKEAATTQSIPPMTRPERPVGYAAIRLVNGMEEVYTLVDKTADTETWEGPSGCRAVYPRTGFAPALKFTNCDGLSGTQVVKLRQGTPYPLTVGGKWVYSYAGKSTRGDRWSGELHCEVASAARVRVDTAERDVCTVVCEDNVDNVKTTYTYTIYRE
ncbi:MAG: hypothetical protein ACREKS_23675 [Candidatus Rokuibacteriota bacterium]